MRLALVMSHPDRRMEGARRELHWLAALRALGVEARLFRMHRGSAEEAWFLDGRVPASFLPADDPEQHVRQQVSAALRDAVAAYRPSLILFKGLGYQVNASVAAAAERRPFGFIAGGLTTDPLLDRASLVLAEHPVQEAADFAALHQTGRSMLLPKYFDPDLAQPVLAEPRFAIINVGNFLDGRKNQKALYPMARRHRTCFVGGGPLLEQAQASCPRALFVGPRPIERVYEYLRNARLMVHPSVHDGLPRAVVEAMACGLPVVAYRHVIASGIRHGETGLLVTPETLEAEVDALLADPERLAAMGAAARAEVHATHGPAAIARAARQFVDLVARLGLD